MRTVNIYEFFPIKDDETMDRYLAKDTDYESRKEQLSTVLLNTIHKSKKKFGSAVIRNIFSPEYIATHRWPTIR